jgi:hypothetical protein
MITFEQYIKITSHLHDKSGPYQYWFLYNNLQLTDQNYNPTEGQGYYQHWAAIYQLDKNSWHPTIGPLTFRKVSELTTEEWSQLTDLIESQTNFSYYLNIIATLTGCQDLDLIKNMPFKELAENVNFFLNIYQIYINILNMSSRPKADQLVNQLNFNLNMS